MTEFVLTRSVLRPPVPADAEPMARYAANRAVSRNLLDRFPYPYGLTDAQEFITTTAERQPPQAFGIIVDGHLVGTIGLEPATDVHRRSMEIGYWLGEPYWGRGIASEAVVAVTEYAFEAFGINRLWAGVFAWNPASARVLEKAGYVLEGRLRSAITKDGETTDELIYSMVR